MLCWVGCTSVLVLLCWLVELWIVNRLSLRLNTCEWKEHRFVDGCIVLCCLARKNNLDSVCVVLCHVIVWRDSQIG